MASNKMSDEDRKAKQNAYYAAWREKLRDNPAAEREYLDRKLAASKRYHIKQRYEFDNEGNPTPKPATPRKQREQQYIFNYEDMTIAINPNYKK